MNNNKDNRRQVGDIEARSNFKWLKRIDSATLLAVVVLAVTALLHYNTLENRVVNLEDDTLSLMDHANKGERFTADDGRELASALHKLTESVGTVMIWRARVDNHIAAHEKSADFWIDTIKENTKAVRKLSDELLQLRVRHENGNE